MDRLSTREFHISRLSRQKYQVDDVLFSISGNAVFANYHAARLFAHQMNSRRDPAAPRERSVRAGDLYAMGLIDEILHYIITLYREQVKNTVMAEALAEGREHLGDHPVDALLHHFVTEFPSADVYRGKLSPEQYLSDSAHPPVVLEEILMLWLANTNPAFSPFIELFDDSGLRESGCYDRMIEGLNAFFKKQPPFGPDHLTLIDMLRAPALASPHSLKGQLEYIRSRWGILIQDRYLHRLLSSLDYMLEESKQTGTGPGPASPPDFTMGMQDAERFSPDLDWMPRVVMIAKNAYVWLDQLSRETGRTLTRLDQIPDEILDALARWGFTTLWLIGIWERSPASKRIKQMCGNPEAEASAYALFDYRIAEDLGGDQAFENLKVRAWQRGIRMAGDMVPNHVGIDSRWVIQHPDWFISLPYSPFPSYSFNGPDLSHDERVGIYLEDHYFNRTDAAVVFKRQDHWTGEARYIYHGNDGTSMPWNDTAQLNFLNPETREAVIQTILHVARQFPVIRFDAAMTLTQKHFQRLWFPEPGHGGDIVTRAEQGLTKDQFLQAMPKEFWREVVDRVSAEAPDTLLLAEAFWLLEGYFVRTLGMHRVYNSAFMNMLKNEDNRGYRDLIRRTLAFNPEILKRYVNFMNNPDEDTAIAQFGKDDKYFGVCLLMATMPGLPMFGHGQIEGLTEKYGMEYRRAYHDEIPDSRLIQRHEREIFPVLLKRYLFANVDAYCLYDMVTPEGHVNEDVFVQSNRSGEESALYVYHNAWADTRGWIRRSVITGRSPGEGLGLKRDSQMFTIFEDHITGLEYIRSNQELFEAGLYVELGAFKYHLFWKFRQVPATDACRTLHDDLNGRGVPDMDEAFSELQLKPVLDPFHNLIQPDLIKTILQAMADPKLWTEALQTDLRSKVAVFYTAVFNYIQGNGDLKKAVQTTEALLHAALQPVPRSRIQRAFVDRVCPGTVCERMAVLGWSLLTSSSLLTEETPDPAVSRAQTDALHLGKPFLNACAGMNLDEAAQWETVSMMHILIGQNGPDPFVRKPAEEAFGLCRIWFEHPEIRQFLGFNRHEGVLYFNQERFDMMIRGLFYAAWLRLHDLAVSKKTKAARTLSEIFVFIREAETDSEYQVEKMMRALEKSG